MAWRSTAKGSSAADNNETVILHIGDSITITSYLPFSERINAFLDIRINKEFPANKWERLQFLDWKTEFSTLNIKEEAEALKLAEAYEDFSVERIKSLAQLATIRRIHIDELMEQLGLKPSARG